jgi:hypothetical protein
MKRVWVLLGLAAFLVGAFVFPSAHAGPLEEQFFQMDTSRDGAISRSEFMTYQISNGETERGASFAFENLRGDDNQVSLTEFRSGPYATRRAPQRLERRSNARQDTRTRNARRSRPRSNAGRLPSRGGGGS